MADRPSGKVRLDNAAVRAIRKRIAAGETMRAIAADFAVNRQTIHNIKVGKRKEHLPGRRRVTQWKPPQKKAMPASPPEDIVDAGDVEQHARADARKDRKAGFWSGDAFKRRSRATQHAAFYLVEHPSLYRRDTKEARQAAYEEWMNRYIGWYEDEASGKGTRKQ